MDWTYKQLTPSFPNFTLCNIEIIHTYTGIRITFSSTLLVCMEKQRGKEPSVPLAPEGCLLETNWDTLVYVTEEPVESYVKNMKNMSF